MASQELYVQTASYSTSNPTEQTQKLTILGRGRVHRRRSGRCPNANIHRRPTRPHPLHANDVRSRDNRHHHPNCLHQHRHVPRRPRASRLRSRVSHTYSPAGLQYPAKINKLQWHGRNGPNLPERNLRPKIPRSDRRNLRLRHLIRNNDVELGWIRLQLRAIRSHSMAPAFGYPDPLGSHHVRWSCDFHA